MAHMVVHDIIVAAAILVAIVMHDVSGTAAILDM
jgi:hypothetical protein